MDIVLPRRLLSKDLVTSDCFDCFEAFGNGIFQSRLLVLNTLAVFLTNINGLVVPLISTNVKHWCKQSSTSNSSEATWKNATLSKVAETPISRCELYKYTQGSNNTETMPCEEWVYDDQQVRTTIVSEWNLVCQRRFLRETITVIHNAGTVFLAIPAGCIADSIGRKPVLLAGVTVLIVSSVSSCLSKSYATYTTFKFFTSGCASVVACLTMVSLFEVTIHDRRPLHVVLSAFIGILLSELWYVIFLPLKLGWMLKQSLFILPTVLSLPLFWIISESPRWLVSKGRLESAEVVMMAAAEANHFLYAHTACMIHKLKTDIAINAKRLPAINQHMLGDCSVQRRTFIMSVSYFSMTFAAFVTVYTQRQDNEPWFTPASFALNLLFCLLMYLMITRMTMRCVMTTWFVIMGATQCLLSIVAGTDATMVEVALTLLSSAMFYSGLVLSFCYILELSPTPVRATLACWGYACSRLGAVAAFIAVVLQRAGRLDLVYAIGGLFLMTSLAMQRNLPRDTTVECAKEEANRASVISQRSMAFMKKSLEPKAVESNRSKSSFDVSHRSSVVSRSHLRDQQETDG